MRVLYPLILLLVTAFLVVRSEAQKSIEYLGYNITITLPKTENYSAVRVRKGRKTLALHSEGLAQEYGSNVELKELLGNGRKQLIISQYTGGNHCCNVYWIYELKPRFRLLFRSMDFQTIGNSETEELFQNIDGDADLEIVDYSPSFHYFDNLAFVSSPVPKLIFDYDHRTRKFELANRRFAENLLKDSAESIRQSEAVRESDPSQHRVWSLSIFLDFVYAGRERTGWNFYHHEKAISVEAKSFHEDEVIKQVLRSDPAYRSLYKK